MEKWRRVWREGFGPLLSTRSLQLLQNALVHDDPQLVQGAISEPPFLDGLQEHAVEATCALGFCGWQGEECHSVGQLDEFFQRLCDAADAHFTDAAACRFFFNWYDDTPRDEMRQELYAEVTLALKQRRAVAA
jgi:hypothetical protein